MYTVQVKVGDEYTLHSRHRSYCEASDQANIVHGRVKGIDEDTAAFSDGYVSGLNSKIINFNDLRLCPYYQGTSNHRNWIAGYEKGQN